MASWTASVRPPTVLIACALLGLFAGGLRSPAAWLAAGSVVWLTALLRPFPAATPLLKPWLLWLGWALLSLAACSQPLKGLYALGHWATLICFLGLGAASWGRQDSRRAFAALAAGAFLLGLGALFLPPALHPGTRVPIHPMTGFMPPYYNYTVFALAAFAAAALGVLAHPGGPRGRRRWALAALAAFAVALILKARSRGGLLALSAAACVWLVRRGRARWLAWGAVGALAAVALLPQEAVAYLLKLDVWGFGRPEIWKAALRIVGDDPLLGEGLGNFAQGFLRHNFPSLWGARYGFVAAKAESELLGTAAETGVVGLALFLWALRGWRPGSTVEQEGGLLAFSAMSAQALVDNFLHMPALAMLYLSSILAARTDQRTPHMVRGTGALPRPTRAGRRAWAAGCLAGLALLLVSPVPSWLVERRLDRYRETTDPAERLLAARRAAAVFPADYYLREKLALAWMRLGPPRPREALAELARAWELHPTRALYPALQAEILASGGRDAEAVRLLNRAIGLEPDFLKARALRAELWARRGNRRAAERELEEIRQRQGRLAKLPGRRGGVYPAYDRLITGFDAERLEAARRKVLGR